MSEPTKELKYNYQTDQQVSVNAFLDVEIAGEPFRLQVTNRYGSTPEKIVKTTTDLIAALTTLRETNARPDKPAASVAQTSAPRSGDGEGTYENPKTFIPAKLVVEYKDGKEFFKVCGQPGKFPKFPVSVWPEVLEKTGINYLDRGVLDPKDGLKLEGWTAFYIVNEKGNPAKVIRLEQEFA